MRFLTAGHFDTALAAADIGIAVGSGSAAAHDAADIVIGLGRQTVHKVKLYVALSATEGNTNRAHKILLANVLVNNVTKSLSSRLGRKR